MARVEVPRVCLIGGLVRKITYMSEYGDDLAKGNIDRTGGTHASSI